MVKRPWRISAERKVRAQKALKMLRPEKSRQVKMRARQRPMMCKILAAIVFRQQSHAPGRHL
ncbi:hypothetical protein [Thalassospira marina]|uniref:hypothetical protein n=1 Tax=Thalassospira marina TaxID=2048283 RepID=UPI001054BE0B|nr:hypothetical protein [Thalassospira marina]